MATRLKSCAMWWTSSLLPRSISCCLWIIVLRLLNSVVVCLCFTDLLCCFTPCSWWKEGGEASIITNDIVPCNVCFPWKYWSVIDKYCDALKSAMKDICEVQILDSRVSGMFKSSLYLFRDAFLRPTYISQILLVMVEHEWKCSSFPRITWCMDPYLRLKASQHLVKVW